MSPSFFYVVLLILAAGYFLRQMGRIAKAQEESAKLLYEIAWSMKTMAIHKAETDKAAAAEAAKAETDKAEAAGKANKAPSA
ncbi:MAG TPA: hypothetical protein VK968_18175 [Roseimicrobium sp.]|nr:hypothetical protein [Roseimicrobium sp.]